MPSISGLLHSRGAVKYHQREGNEVLQGGEARHSYQHATLLTKNDRNHKLENLTMKEVEEEGGGK